MAYLAFDSLTAVFKAPELSGTRITTTATTRTKSKPNRMGS